MPTTTVTATSPRRRTPLAPPPAAPQTPAAAVVVATDAPATTEETRRVHRGLLDTEATVTGYTVGAANRLQLRHTRYSVQVVAVGHAAAAAPQTPNNAQTNESGVRTWVVDRRYYEFQRLRDVFAACDFPCPQLPPRRLWGASARTEAELERKVESLDIWLQGSLAVWKSLYYGDVSSEARAATEALVEFLCSPRIFRVGGSGKGDALPPRWRLSLRRFFMRRASSSHTSASALASAPVPAPGSDVASPSRSKAPGGRERRSIAGALAEALASLKGKSSGTRVGLVRASSSSAAAPSVVQHQRRPHLPSHATTSQDGWAPETPGTGAGTGNTATGYESEDGRAEVEMLRRLALQDDDGTELEWTFSSEDDRHKAPKPAAGATDAAPDLSTTGATAGGMEVDDAAAPIPPSHQIERERDPDAVFLGPVLAFEDLGAVTEADYDCVVPLRADAGDAVDRLFRVSVALEGGKRVAAAQRKLYSSVSVPRSPKARTRFRKAWMVYTDKVLAHAAKRLERRVAANMGPRGGAASSAAAAAAVGSVRCV